MEGCSLCTYWDIVSGEQNLDDDIDVTKDHIKYCVNTVMDNKNLPQQVTLRHKGRQIEKKRAFRTNGHLQLQTVQKEPNQKMTETKETPQWGNRGKPPAVEP